MVTHRTHFHYVADDGLWKSACSYKGYEVDGIWYNHDAGEFHSAGHIRHRHMLAAPQMIDCKVCLQNPKLKKLLDELSPWPDPSLQDERMAAYLRDYPNGTPWQKAFHAARREGRYLDIE